MRERENKAKRERRCKEIQLMLMMRAPAARQHESNQESLGRTAAPSGGGSERWFLLMMLCCRFNCPGVGARD